jgi:hypothetical protein
LTISLFLLLTLPFSIDAHEGELDAFGCHYDKEHKNYHCHQGAFKGGSFGSKTEMIHSLKLQYLNIGRPWPYGDIMEEDITSPQPEAPEEPETGAK